MIGDQLRTKMVLSGHPSCPDTGKCLQLAGEKGVDIAAVVISGLDDSALLAKSPYGVAPMLEDIDFVVYGTGAVLSYLDDKGFGPSLVPRHGLHRAVMYQWAGIATEKVQSMLGENIDKAGLETLFDGLAQQIQNPPKKGDFICGDFTLADIHWAACCNCLEIGGAGDLISSRAAVSAWYEQVKAHPSTSKETLVPFTCLPTAEDVRSGTLRDISINA